MIFVIENMLISEKTKNLVYFIFEVFFKKLKLFKIPIKHTLTKKYMVCIIFFIYIIMGVWVSD